MKTTIKKLRVLKNDVLYFHIIKYWDKQNGNTYGCFNQGYVIRKGQRLFLTDWGSLNITNWKPNVSNYIGGEDSYNIAKQWLNKNSNLEISYMSDYPQIIISDEYLDKKQYNRLTK
jgi:hypothetical protein